MNTPSPDIESRVPPYDASHEVRRDLAADRLRRLRSHSPFYRALAVFREMVNGRSGRTPGRKDVSQ